MTEIFKYFFGIIGIIIIVYIFIIVFRTVVIGSFSATKDVVTNREVQTGVASTTTNIATWLSQFTLQNFFSSWRPFQYEPGTVKVSNPKNNFYNTSNFGAGWRQKELYWQGLSEAPNNHPTDYVYLNENQNPYVDSAENTDSNDSTKEDVPTVIFPSISLQTRLSTRDTITGYAYYEVFTDNYFLVYILDEYGNILGKVKAFSNGNIRRDGLVPFRTVLSFENPGTNGGFLLFKTANPSLPFKTLSPIYFK